MVSMDPVSIFSHGAPAPSLPAITTMKLANTALRLHLKRFHEAVIKENDHEHDKHEHGASFVLVSFVCHLIYLYQRLDEKPDEHRIQLE